MRDWTRQRYRNERFDRFWSNETIEREKDGKKRLRLLFVSDLHLGTEARQVERLCQSVKRLRPELILIAGDILTAKLPQCHSLAEQLLKQWAAIAPVIVSLGNHEMKWPETAAAWREIDRVTVLDNETVHYDWAGDLIQITGLTLNKRHFARGRRPHLTMEELCACIGRRKPQGFHILLAHHPAYSRQYRRWGADLTLSGHYHGGLLRLPFFGGVLSPQLVPFPQYSRGCYGDEHRLHLVTTGAGDHTGLPRWWNPKELVCVDLVKEQGRIRIDTMIRMERK
ncbi:MAG: metallophosphoesterase [Eubacteriales bacterium]|nr:metallophosphoesterase [Eubacteriales bacterium]